MTAKIGRMRKSNLRVSLTSAAWSKTLAVSAMTAVSPLELSTSISFLGMLDSSMLGFLTGSAAILLVSVGVLLAYQAAVVGLEYDNFK
jgi:hypothetical protein